MAANTTGRQRVNATGQNRQHPAPKIRVPSDECQPTGGSWRMIRSGEYIGARGEFRVLACECGATRRMLWSVDAAPWRGGDR